MTAHTYNYGKGDQRNLPVNEEYDKVQLWK